MNTEYKLLREITFPELILDKQDKSDKFGKHWVETVTSKNSNKTHMCVLLKNESGLKYYLPIEMPYEIGREDNDGDSHYAVMHKEREARALISFLKPNLFMPTLDFIKTVDANTWMNIYIDLVRCYPERIKALSDFSFFVLSDDEKYKDEYLVCYPFLNICRDNNTYKYNDKDHDWINGDLERKEGNIYLFRKKYQLEFFGRKILPIVTNRRG